MKNLEKIRKACIKANPEIMELKFGCVEKRHYRNLYDKNGQPEFDTKVMYLGTTKTQWKDEVVFLDDQGKPNMDYHCSKKEIIGRPIQLADVLLALDKKRETGSPVWLVASHGEFILWENKKVKERSVIYWNLKKPLEEQSKETIDFIAELINP